MSSAGALGAIEPDDNARREPLQVAAYLDFAGPARAAVVSKMLDPNVEVMEGRKNNAAFFFDRRKQAEVVAAGVIGIKPDPVIPRGRIALLNQNEADRFGFCKLKNKESRLQVAEAYGLSSGSMQEDPLQGREPKGARIILKGQVDRGFQERITRRVRKAIADGANTIIFHFDSCGGGNTEIARAMADEFRQLRDSSGSAPVRTIAFVPQGAPDAATFLAFGCNEIVMAKVEGDHAVLGDFSRLMQTPEPGRRRAPVAAVANTDAVRLSLRELAESQGIPPILVDGMFQPELEIFRARTIRGGAVERTLMTAQELENDRLSKDPQWQSEEQIKHKGKFLKLGYEAARKYGVVRHVVDNPEDVQQVYSRLNLTGKVREARPDWLDAISEFLRHPVVAVLLVMIGTICLILELKIPGATAPGVIAALCFVLFFWSQSEMSGQIIILAVLLFLLGLILIGIEVFVLPGFGFVGISGIVLMVVGLGLATVEKMPQSGSEWLGFGKTLTQFGVGLVLAGFGAIIIARYLPNIPIANRMVLTPPTEKSEAEAAAAMPGVEQASAFLGAVGEAATMLRPAGMAKFGEQFVDVVTEGGFVPAGARVQVIEVEGNRIVVKEV
jgi:membrane-bound ClpP family serine protease